MNNPDQPATEQTLSHDNLLARKLSPQAQRALAEAAERRRIRDEQTASRPKEIGGRDGLDPVRYGDWEKGGIAWDF